MNHDRGRRVVLGCSLFYAATVTYICLYLYPVWREVQYEQHPSRIAVAFDYLGLAAVICVLAMLVPFVLAMPSRRKLLAWAVVFFITSVALQAAYFMYCGRYLYGRAPRFAIEFPRTSFFSEFRNLKLVFSSPLIAAVALAICWRWRERAPVGSDT